MFLAPFRGLLWISAELAKIAESELDQEREDIKTKLRELYLRLEANIIDERAFDAAEKALLDRLDALTEDTHEDAEGGLE